MFKMLKMLKIVFIYSLNIGHNCSSAALLLETVPITVESVDNSFNITSIDI